MRGFPLPQVCPCSRYSPCCLRLAAVEAKPSNPPSNSQGFRKLAKEERRPSLRSKARSAVLDGTKKSFSLREATGGGYNLARNSHSRQFDKIPPGAVPRTLAGSMQPW